ncbi:MAG: hypothetical protein WCO69_03925 [Candidatus Omnitrophota bacterium]
MLKTIKASVEMLAGKKVAFLFLAPFEGCFGFCDYCLTPLLRPELIKGRIVSRGGLPALAHELRSFSAGLKRQKVVIQFGQFQDPFALEKWQRTKTGKGIIAPLIALFRALPNMTLTILSKFPDPDVLAGVEPAQNVILASTLNTEHVRVRYERGTPSSAQRLKALATLKKQGWKVAVRVDPVIFYPGWAAEYGRLFKQARALGPEAVVFGVLRHTPDIFRRSSTALRRKLEEDGLSDMGSGEERVAEVHSLMRRSLGTALMRRSLPISFRAVRQPLPLLWTRGIAANPLTAGLEKQLQQMGIYER